jgi:PhnB protein
MTTLSPYLGFRSEARQAMEFYRSVFGGDLTLSTFGEFETGGPEEKDLVMHAQLTTAAGMVLMGSDTPSAVDYTPGSAISVSLFGDDETELTGYWQELSAGGVVLEPLAKAPWGDSFGMCTDAFGVTWLVNITGATS